MAYDGLRLLIDKSAYARAGQPAIRDEWLETLFNGQLLASPVFYVEALYSARQPEEFAELEEELSALPFVRFTRRTHEVAGAAMRSLCAVRPSYHRLPVEDALVAALAHERRAGVLHYDAHYDRLAEVLDFESRWVAPPGTLV